MSVAGSKKVRTEISYFLDVRKHSIYMQRRALIRNVNFCMAVRIFINIKKFFNVQQSTNLTRSIFFLSLVFIYFDV